MPGVGLWGFAFSFLPTALFIRPSTTSTVLELTLTALPLTVWAWVRTERVLELLITIPLLGRGGPGEAEREIGSDVESELAGVCGLEWAT